LKRELEGVVGWHSIHKSLKATVGNDVPLFEPVFEDELVSPRTPSNEASATLMSTDTTKMLLSDSENRKKLSKAGRKKLFHRIPEFTEQFQKLGIEPSRTSDVLPQEALCSAKKTRKAMEEALIRRKPGQYGRDMLAKRLGMSIRTIDTYHKEFAAEYPDFNRRHRYFETPIYWNNLNEIADEGTLHNGFFLTDDTGKHYPAKRTIAIMLLQRKRRVTLMRQTWNEYWFGLPFQPPSRIEQVEQPAKVPEKQPEPWREPANAYWAALHDVPETHHRTKPAQFGDFTEPATQHKQRVSKTLKMPLSAKKDKRLHNPRRPFPYTEDEALVEKLQQRVNALCWESWQNISKKTLRGLILEYGKSIVKAAVKRTEELDYIDQNPPGFLISMLRSDSKRGELQELMRSQRWA
jgi:DNA-binding transcriptional regulator of glucitol operon